MMKDVIMAWLPLLAGVVGWFARRVASETQWRAVRAIALRLLGDDRRPDVIDPRTAVAEALLTVQLERLDVEAKRVVAAFGPLNGASKIPNHATERTP